MNKFSGLLVGLSLVAAFAVGVFISPRLFSANPLHQNSETRLGGYKLINPLLFCDSNQESPNPQVIQIKDRLTALINREYSKLDIAVYYRDLNNGPWFGINENKPYSPASLLKVPILIAAYKQAEEQPDFLTQKFTYSIPATSPSDPVQDLPIDQTLKIGETYTVEDLLYRMIVYSDNQSTNFLKNILGQERLIATYSGLGLSLPNNGFDDFLSTHAYSTIYRILYNASYLDKFQSQKALLLLSQTNFNSGLSSGLPDSTTIAHKFGERQNSTNIQIHDCGIVYHSRSPYVLCIMTRGQDKTLQTSAISSLSKLVYEGVSYFTGNSLE